MAPSVCVCVQGQVGLPLCKIWREPGLVPGTNPSLEAQQRYFSYHAILVAIASRNYLVLVFVGYRIIIAPYVAKWGIAQMLLCNTKYQGGVSHHFGEVLISLQSIVRCGATKNPSSPWEKPGVVTRATGLKVLRLCACSLSDICLSLHEIMDLLSSNKFCSDPTFLVMWEALLLKFRSLRSRSLRRSRRSRRLSRRWAQSNWEKAKGVLQGGWAGFHLCSLLPGIFLIASQTLWEFPLRFLDRPKQRDCQTEIPWPTVVEPPKPFLTQILSN